MGMPAEKTAVVLIEPQNDFLSPGGTMYQYIAEQLVKLLPVAVTPLSGDSFVMPTG